MQVLNHLVDGVATGTTAKVFVGVVFLYEVYGFLLQGPADELSVDGLDQRVGFVFPKT